MSFDDRGERLVWEAHTSMVGPVTVRRPLPTRAVPSVGPFVLLDHFGPIPAPREKLPAHPHAGIEVMTYLLDGANEHTDSLGNIGRIDAGGAQWMKAGSGILHTERNLLERSDIMHGLQIWARLPVSEQASAPDYRAYQSEEMVEWKTDGVRIRLVSGALHGHQGPIKLALSSVMAHLFLPGGSHAEIALTETDHEYAIYIISGDEPITVNGSDKISAGSIMRFENSSKQLEFRTNDGAEAQIFLLGGAPAPQPLVFGGSFVLDSQQALNDANRRFQAGEMGTLDGVPF